MRVLIADDSLLSRRLLEETLRVWGYDVTVARDGKEAWQLLNVEQPPALAILDWMMPGYTGPELCSMLRKKATAQYTYILLLTSRNEKGDVVKGMDSGADDYVTKPFDKHELQVRLRAGIRILDLQDQLLATQEALRIQATRDYLTQVPNRSAIFAVLQRELSRSEREGGSVGVVLADLDHFKSVNDTYGHLAGDLVLKQAVRRIELVLRPYDTIGRYGGEEFLIILPGSDEQTARNLADRMRESIASTKVIFGKDQKIDITCSFGCTAGNHLFTEAELIQSADEALYRAKRAGRNRALSVPPASNDSASQPNEQFMADPQPVSGLS